MDGAVVRWGDGANALLSPRRLALAAVLLAVLVTPARPTDTKPGLLWPLPIREGCTSSFGEYRRTHFHGGVDMRTHQEDGWPCFAAADGSVVRIRREPGGYGRVLYLQLKDGRTAVYAHLTRFSVKLGLEAKLRAACERAGTSFPGDVPVEPPVPVKAGDVVAYSGDLGVGAPHLHFEIRRGDDLCDPFAEGLPLPAGMVPPRFTGLAVVPRDADSRVDGGFLPVLVPAVKSGDGYRLARTVSVSGPVDLFAVAEDHLGVSDNTTGLPVLSASVDGAPFFKMDLRCISLARFRQAPAIFEPDFQHGGANAYRLRRLPWLEVGGIEGDGFPAGLAAGPHELNVTAANRADQSATLAARLDVKPVEPDGLDALPGSGYRVRSHAITPAGLVLTVQRGSAAGSTAISIGGRVLTAVRARTLGDGTVQVLLPREALPSQGAPVSFGGVASEWQVAAGPGRIVEGKLRLTLPAGAVGVATPAPTDAEFSGTAARLEVGPYECQTRASVDFTGVPSRPRVGVYGGGIFLDNWTGKAVPFLVDGVYCLREDDSPPQWGRPRLVRIPHIDEAQLWLDLSDRGSGPNLNSLRLSLDGRPAFADWDPDTHTVRVDLRGLRPGRHTLAGSVGDWAGNTAKLPPTPFTLR